jgi:hypothetical protein
VGPSASVTCPVMTVLLGSMDGTDSSVHVLPTRQEPSSFPATTHERFERDATVHVTDLSPSFPAHARARRSFRAGRCCGARVIGRRYAAGFGASRELARQVATLGRDRSYWKAISELPVEYREVARMVDVHDRTSNAVANVRGVPSAAVRFRFQLARRIPQAMLIAHSDDIECVVLRPRRMAGQPRSESQ